jgi:hypothetical protein
MGGRPDHFSCKRQLHPRSFPESEGEVSGRVPRRRGGTAVRSRGNHLCYNFAAGVVKEFWKNMSVLKHKLGLVGALTALIGLAFAISCKGFFPPEQLGSITISPSTANVPLGGTFQLEAFGTNTDSSPAGNITGNVTWSSSSGAVTVNTAGKLTGVDLTSSAVTITAEDQGVSATASANVCVENASNFTITLSDTTVVANTSVTAFAYASVPGVTGQTDVSPGTTWSTSNSSVTITNGDPATIDTSGLSSETSSTTVAILATYSCNGVNNNFQTNLTVTPASP